MVVVQQLCERTSPPSRVRVVQPSRGPRAVTRPAATVCEVTSRGRQVDEIGSRRAPGALSVRGYTAPDVISLYLYSCLSFLLPFPPPPFPPLPPPLPRSILGPRGAGGASFVARGSGRGSSFRNLKPPGRSARPRYPAGLANLWDTK